jgi:hypothetical protein
VQKQTPAADVREYSIPADHLPQLKLIDRCMSMERQKVAEARARASMIEAQAQGQLFEDLAQLLQQTYKVDVPKGAALQFDAKKGTITVTVPKPLDELKQEIKGKVAPPPPPPPPPPAP